MGLFEADHLRFRHDIREIVSTRLSPNAIDWEARRQLPRDVFLTLGDLGLLGLSQNVEHGGRGLDFTYEVIFAEELVKAKMFGLGLSVMAQTQFFSPLLADLGTAEQQRRFLKPVIRGEVIGALAITEPTGGSDVTRSLECRAVADGDSWVINGEKKYITNGPIADFVVMLARTKEERSTTSLTLIILPTATKGFSVKETLRTLGMHTSPTGWLTFNDCRVPKSLTLGKEHLGFFYLTPALLRDRLIASVTAIAIAELVLTETIHYLRSRRAYDTTLSKLQAVRHKVSEMAAEIEMARRFVYSICESYRDGKVEAKQICMAKYQVIEIAQRVVERCLQLHGGYGFLEENWISRAYRDVRVLSVGGGASELMKDLVAGYLRL